MLSNLIRNTKEVHVITWIASTLFYAGSFTCGATVSYNLYPDQLQPNQSFLSEQFTFGGFNGLITYPIFAFIMLSLEWMMQRERSNNDYILAMSIIPLPIIISGQPKLVHENNQTGVFSSWIITEIILMTIIFLIRMSKTTPEEGRTNATSKPLLTANHNYGSDEHIIDIKPFLADSLISPRKKQPKIKKTLPQQTAFFRNQFPQLNNQEKVDWLEKNYEIEIEFPAILDSMLHCSIFRIIMDDPVGIPKTNATMESYNAYADQEECVERRLITKWLNDNNNKNPYRSTSKLYERDLKEKSYLKLQINFIINDITEALHKCNKENPQLAKEEIKKTLNNYMKNLGTATIPKASSYKLT